MIGAERALDRRLEEIQDEARLARAARADHERARERGLVGEADGVRIAAERPEEKSALRRTELARDAAVRVIRRFTGSAPPSVLDRSPVRRATLGREEEVEQVHASSSSCSLNGWSSARSAGVLPVVRKLRNGVADAR